MESPIRVLIADDHPVVRCGLTHMLDAEPDLAVVGEASDKDELKEQLVKLEPDVTILDLELGDLHGCVAVEVVRKVSPKFKIIVYSAYDDIQRIVQSVELGVHGYLIKDVNNHELVRAVRSVHEGGTVLESSIAAKLIGYLRQPSESDTNNNVLSRREREVLDLIAKGASNRYIADKLFISERTVKFHVSAILSKLNAQNRTEAVLIAVQRGIVQLTTVKIPPPPL